MAVMVTREAQAMNAVHVELTSRCNLRCVYCRLCQPNYLASDMPAEVIDEVVAFLLAERPRLVSMNGHGETTLLEGWHRHCTPLIAAGLPLHIITNLARNLTPEDVDTLARFHSLEVSLDTADAELLKETRRKADLRTILYNILQIRAAAIRNVIAGVQRKLPTYSLSVVVHDKNIFHLEELICLGQAVGVRNYIFCNMTKYPDVEGAVNVQPLAQLPEADIPKALHALGRVAELAEQFKLSVNIVPGLVESLRERLSSGKSVGTQNGPGMRFTQEVPPGFTRDCTDPWRFMMFKASGDVVPCCWYPSAVGKITGRGSLKEIHNNDTLRTLRAQLGSGDLADCCRICPARGLISVAEFQNKYPELFVVQTG